MGQRTRYPARHQSDRGAQERDIAPKRRRHRKLASSTSVTMVPDDNYHPSSYLRRSETGHGDGPQPPLANNPVPLQIDHSQFPHIIDTVISYATWEALGAFASTSRYYKHRIEAMMFKHMVLSRYADKTYGVAVGSPHGPLPHFPPLNYNYTHALRHPQAKRRKAGFDWRGAALGYARIVDVCGPIEELIVWLGRAMTSPEIVRVYPDTKGECSYATNIPITVPTLVVAPGGRFKECYAPIALGVSKIVLHLDADKQPVPKFRPFSWPIQRMWFEEPAEPQYPPVDDKPSVSRHVVILFSQSHRSMGLLPAGAPGFGKTRWEGMVQVLRSNSYLAYAYTLVDLDELDPDCFDLLDELEGMSLSQKLMADVAGAPVFGYLGRTIKAPTITFMRRAQYAALPEVHRMELEV